MRSCHASARRWNACVLLAVGWAAFRADVLPAAEPPSQPAALEQLRKERHKAAHRKRRIIMNNDGNEAVYQCDEPTRAEFLKHRTTGIVGTQIDTLFYCTWSSGFSHFTHNTKVGKVFDTKANPPGAARGYGFAKNITGDLIRQGTDPLQLVIDFCRQHDVEVFWSMRMNDTHDASGSWYGPPLFPPLKKEHPEWLLGSRDKRPKRGRWTAVDYGRPEIRDLAFRFVEEVCRDYDVDGVELDFFRHLNYFKRPSRGLPASQEECDMMSGLLRRIREMTERVGLARGRPILVAVRVPDSPGYCKAHGLDLLRWLEEGLIDILVPSGYFRLNPWEVSVELGHRHGVAVYPCLSESRISDSEARKIRMSDESYRARAMNVWASGADGVYTFNRADPTLRIYREIGDPQTLRTLDKVYTTGARGVRGANSWQAGGLRFLGYAPLSPQRPRVLKPGEPVTVELPVGEDLAASKPGGTLPDVRLAVRIKGDFRPEELAVRLNGKPLAEREPSGRWIRLPVNPADVRKGPNRVEMTLKPDGKDKLVVDDLVLWVRHPKKP